MGAAAAKISAAFETTFFFVSIFNDLTSILSFD